MRDPIEDTTFRTLLSRANYYGLAYRVDRHSPDFTRKMLENIGISDARVELAHMTTRSSSHDVVAIGCTVHGYDCGWVPYN